MALSFVDELRQNVKNFKEREIHKEFHESLKQAIAKNFDMIRAECLQASMFGHHRVSYFDLELPFHPEMTMFLRCVQHTPFMVQSILRSFEPDLEVFVNQETSGSITITFEW